MPNGVFFYQTPKSADNFTLLIQKEHKLIIGLERRSGGQTAVAPEEHLFRVGTCIHIKIQSKSFKQGIS